MAKGSPRALVPPDIGGIRGANIGAIADLFGGRTGQLGNLLGTLGPMGVPTTGLQRQSLDAFSRMLSQPTPEQRALDISLPALQGMLTGTGPQFEQDIALANAGSGNRFSSANALLRGEALRNLYNLRNQTAGTIGMLGQGAGAANRALAGQGFQVGTAEAGQQDIETQRRLQVLMGLLGAGQQAAFNVPIQAPGGGLGGILGGIGGMALGSVLGPFGAAVGGNLGNQVTSGKGAQG